MPSSKLNSFREAVIAKKYPLQKLPTYRTSFRRLYLTRRAAEFILSALLIFSGYQLIIVNDFFSPVWLYAGVAVSALFLRGNALLAGIFAGSLFCYLYYGYPFSFSLKQALCFSLIIYLIRATSLKFVGPVAPLASLAVLWKFILICAVFSAIHVSLIGFLFSQNYQTSVSIFGWTVAFLGELNGILCLTPLCLAFTPFVAQRYLTKKSKVWAWIGALIVICHFGFFWVDNGYMSFLLALLLSFCIIGYALCFSLIPLCVTLFGTSIVYLAGALPDAYLFQEQSTQLETLIPLLTFSLAVVISLSIAVKNQQNIFEQSPQLLST